MLDLSSWTTESQDSTIVFRQAQSRITFLNPKKRKVRKIAVDGHVPIKGKRCDYLLIDFAQKEHYIELKGSRVEHGIEQIESTVQQVSPCLNANWKKRRKYAYVVYSGKSVKSKSYERKYAVKFKQDYNTLLRVCRSGHEVLLQDS